MNKSTVDEIRERFDADVERFSNLETGQSATIDAPIALELIAQAAAVTTPNAKRLLDIGCGAGNYSLKQLEYLPNLEVTLIDLSLPMLERAVQRLHSADAPNITPIQGDIREIDLDQSAFDIILAAAVLHHLRTDEEWHIVFSKIYHSLSDGGSFWIFDKCEASTEPINSLMTHRHSDHLLNLKDEAFRDHVFAYIEKEDTPSSLMFQIGLLKEVGFKHIEILHKNGPFTSFGGVK